MDGRLPGRREATGRQNPAYSPTRLPLTSLSWDDDPLWCDATAYTPDGRIIWLGGRNCGSPSAATLWVAWRAGHVAEPSRPRHSRTGALRRARWLRVVDVVSESGLAPSRAWRVHRRSVSNLTGGAGEYGCRIRTPSSTPWLGALLRGGRFLPVEVIASGSSELVDRLEHEKT